MLSSCYIHQFNVCLLSGEDRVGVVIISQANKAYSTVRPAKNALFVTNKMLINSTIFITNDMWQANKFG